MRFVIVTGMSGAGKTSALKFLEDINFFCVDNLPPALIPKFAELCYEQGGGGRMPLLHGGFERVAIGIDIRGGKLFYDLFSVLFEMQENGYDYEILFFVPLCSGGCGVMFFRSGIYQRDRSLPGMSG